MTATRVRDSFHAVADDPDRLTRQLETNRGDKTSALETIGQVPTAKAVRAATLQAAGAAWDAKASDTVAPAPAKPELEKKIDDGGGRSRQVDFDL